jgi:tetratricopeptide (TPR) repeat protein
MPSPRLVLLALLVVSFTLATQLGVWREKSAHDKTQSGGVLQALMGESRRLFANHFFTKADVYLHSGVYPSIFDQAQRAKKSHLSEASSEGGGARKEAAAPEHGDHEEHSEDADHEHEHEHEHEDVVTGLYGRPKDWIDRFGRNFYPTKHTHLERTNQREMLPWLKLAAELNPNQVETYTVAAYWLRSRMGKVKEAEAFLREGCRANPDSFEILFELGRLYEENQKDTFRARNLYECALRKWQASESTKKTPDDFTYMQITGHLARLEERDGRLPEAIRYLELLEKVSPSPQAIRKQIDDLKGRSTGRSQPGTKAG